MSSKNGSNNINAKYVMTNEMTNESVWFTLSKFLIIFTPNAHVHTIILNYGSQAREDKKGDINLARGNLKSLALLLKLAGAQRF